MMVGSVAKLFARSVLRCLGHDADAAGPVHVMRTAFVAKATLAVAFVVLGVSSGCGGDRPLRDLGADEILERAAAAVERQPSVHLRTGGSTYSEPLDWDVILIRDGDSQGRIESGSSWTDFVMAGGVAYLRDDPETVAGELRARGLVSPTVAREVIDESKYLTNASGSAALTSLVQSLLPGIASQIRAQIGAGGTLVSGRTIEGIETVGVAIPGGDGQPSVLYVAADGSDLPLRWESDTLGTAMYSDWGRSAPILPPDPDEVVDLDVLVK